MWPIVRTIVKNLRIDIYNFKTVLGLIEMKYYMQQTHAAYKTRHSNVVQRTKRFSYNSNYQF